MSRYHYEARDGRYVVVGWDNPLQTFFAQVFADAEAYNKDRIADWVGNKPAEVQAVEQLRAWLAERGVPLLASVIEGLEDDYEHRTEPTPLQQWGVRMAAEVIRGKK